MDTDFVKVPTIRDRHIIEDALLELEKIHRVIHGNLKESLRLAGNNMVDDETYLQMREDMFEEEDYLKRINFLLNNVIQERD